MRVLAQVENGDKQTVLKIKKMHAANEKAP